MARSNNVLFASAEFRRGIERANAGLFEQAWKKVDFALNVLASDPTGMQRFERIEHLRDRGIDVLEIDVGGDSRILATYAAHRLTLLAFGKKPVVPGYSVAKYRRDLGSATPTRAYRPPAGLKSASAGNDFFGESQANSPNVYGEVEDVGAWLYFLDDRQGEAANQILEAVKSSTLLDQSRIFLVGPPGTGKTAVLMNVLVRARHHRVKAAISVSDSVARYGELCGLDFASRRWSPGDKKRSWDLVLVDDPGTVGTIEHALDGAFGKSKCVVVAFDPLQLRGEITDAIMEDLIDRHGAQLIRLDQCYRQRETLGRAAKRTLDALARSSAYLVKEKTGGFLQDREVIFRWSNDIEFTFPGGEEHIVEAASRAVAYKTVQQVTSRPMWDHAPGLLVAVQGDCQAVLWPWDSWLRDVRHARVRLDQVDAIKGLDFKHVLLVMGEAMFMAARDGFTGSGRAAYEERKLLRIPFTRARDSLTVIVVKDFASNSHDRGAALLASASPSWGKPYA